MARDFLAQGKRVMIEKPMTHSFDSGLELIKLAEEEERILMVGHTFEYTGAVHKIKEIIQSGELGKILYVQQHPGQPGAFPSRTSMWSVGPGPS